MQRLPRVNMLSQSGAQWNMGACAGGLGCLPIDRSLGEGRCGSIIVPG